MFGENSFGSLGMDESSSQAGPSTTQLEGEEVDVDWLRLIKTNHEVYVRVSDKVDLEGLPQECNLMAVSNAWGLLIVGSSHDIRIHRLQDVHELLEEAAKDAAPVSEPIRTLELPGRPVFIRLAMNEERLVVACGDGKGVCVWRLRDIMGGNTSPYHTFTSDIPPQLLDVLPNPAPSSASDSLSRYIGLIAREGLVIADVEQKKLLPPLTGPFTSGCWSAKGKQIVVGTPAGKLVQYTPEGTPKAELPPPPDLEGSYQPTFVQWLENDLFLVAYAMADCPPDEPLEVFVIHRQREQLTYTKFFDPLDTMGMPDRSGVYRHFAGLKAWGAKTKHLGFMVSGRASEVAVVHAQPGEPPKCEVLILEETARAIMPAAKPGVMDDTACLALELDLTSDKVIKRGIQGGVELSDLPPAPRLLAYSQEGFVISFNVLYDDAGPYPGMVKSQSIEEAPAEDSMDASDEAPAAAPSRAEPRKPTSAFAGFGALGPSAFGSPSTSAKTPTAFGRTSTPAFGSKPTGFGVSAFGQPSAPLGSTPSFGQAAPTTTPASKAPAFGQSGFGQSPAPASTTPSTTPAGKAAFGQSSTPSAFGASAFGSTSTPAAGGFAAFGQSSKSAGSGTSAFGASAFGSASSPSTGGFAGFGAKAAADGKSAFAGFGQQSKPSPASASGSTASTTPADSAFGTTTSKSAFTASSTSAFGGSAFGQSSKPAPAPASGTSAFGQSAKPASITAPSSAFGASAFGQTATPAGASAFGSSAFGQPSKPAAATPPSAFGTPSGSTTSLGFGAFGGAKGVAQTGFGFGTTAMEHARRLSNESGKKPETPSAFGTSAFGKASAFGSGTSAFGAKAAVATVPEKPAFAGFGPKADALANSSSAESGSKPAFSGFGQPKPSSPAPSVTPPIPSPGAAPGGEFGLDSFASALDSSSKPTVPGLEDSPPGSPVFGASKDLNKGLDDDSPPASPLPTVARPPAPAAPTATSAFIRPATAFAAPAAGFGAFSSASTPGSTSAFGTAPTAPAFAASTSSTPAFGQTSTPLATPKPAFGAPTAFGQSSKPIAFGQTSTPSPATKGFGAVSGGFGGFAAKSTDAGGEPKSAFGGFGGGSGGGFGGFAVASAAKSGSASAFGSVQGSSGGFGALLSGGKGETKGQVVNADIGESKVKPQDVPGTASTQASKENPGVSAEITTVEKAEEEEQQETARQRGAGTSPLYRKDSDTASTPRQESTEQAEVSATPGVEAPRETADSNSGGSEEGENADQEEPEIVDPDEEEYSGEEDEDFEEEQYDDEYDEDEEDYGSEEEYDDEEDEEARHRRRSSSIAPDMSPIKEEREDDILSDPQYESDGQLEDGHELRKATKSPPAWFAESTKTDGGPPPLVSPTPVSAQASTSLLSRLGPPPSDDQPSASPMVATAQRLPAAFNLKHAARTSSPLTTQPPRTPEETTTPPDSPADKPAASGGFSFFGQPAGKSDKPVGGFELFATNKGEGKEPIGQKPADAGKPTFGFGLGRPPAQTPPPQKPVEGFFVPPPPPGSQTPKAVEPMPPSTTHFSVPSRSPPPPTPARRPDPAKTMSAVMERMAVDLQDDIQRLKASLDATATFHRKFTVPGFVEISLDELDRHKSLPFNSVPDLSKIVEQLGSELGALTQANVHMTVELAELQAGLLKTDMKSGQIERIIKARQDPAVAKSIEAKDLDPHQASSQTHLRRAVQFVETRLDELESSIAAVKRRALARRQDPSPDALEKIQTSVRNVDQAVRVRQQVVDDLSRRVGKMKLAIPSRTPVKSSAYGALDSPSFAREISLEIPKEMMDEVDRALEREAESVRARRKLFEGVAVARVSRPDSSSSSRKSGPVSLDSPIPSLQADPVKPEPKFTSLSAPPAALTPFGFGGISFSLDPGQITSSAPSARARESATSRRHAPAAKLHSSPSSQPGAATTLLPGSSFVPPTDGSTAAKPDKAAPAGFFSFSGYGK